MKVPICGVTFVLLHVGHLIRAFSFSEMVMVSSNGFLHFSHMNSYLGMVILPDQSSSVERIPRGASRFDCTGPASRSPLRPGPTRLRQGPFSRLPAQEHFIVWTDALSNFQSTCHVSRSLRPRICPNRRGVKWLWASLALGQLAAKGRRPDGQGPPG
jgi:hypothetical protein